VQQLEPLLAPCVLIENCDRANPGFPLGIVLLDQRDRLGFDYRVSSTNAMNIHQQYCIDRAGDESPGGERAILKS
jgi:hypothetical protein